MSTHFPAQQGVPAAAGLPAAAGDTGCLLGLAWHLRFPVSVAEPVTLGGEAAEPLRHTPGDGMLGQSFRNGNCAPESCSRFEGHFIQKGKRILPAVSEGSRHPTTPLPHAGSRAPAVA